ncbi:MAG TPA: hypothetical protein EYG81_05195 [Archaeoglobus profundus]|nr:hypothetical protein [Archaeoglobus profundus]
MFVELCLDEVYKITLKESQKKLNVSFFKSWIIYFTFFMISLSPKPRALYFLTIQIGERSFEFRMITLL